MIRPVQIREDVEKGHKCNLEEVVALAEQNMWPTPTANEDAAGTPDGKMQWMLTQAAKSSCTTRKEYEQQKWQTPTAMEGADCGSKWEALAKLDKGGRIQRQMATRQTVETQTTERAQLNPTWVEWLMGWPIGWTSMDAIEELDWRDWETDPADEGEVPRVATGIKHRVGRLKAIGNGQVPQVAAMAWNILNK